MFGEHGRGHLEEPGLVEARGAARGRVWLVDPVPEVENVVHAAEIGVEGRAGHAGALVAVAPFVARVDRGAAVFGEKISGNATEEMPCGWSGQGWIISLVAR